MIKSYFKDTIRIVSNAVNDWGVSVQNESIDIPARVEDSNKLVIDKNGKEVQANILIMIAESNAPKYEDMIKIRKIKGDDCPLKDKKFIIKSMSKEGGFKSSHWEIYL
jgi:hypothetical protein